MAQLCVLLAPHPTLKTAAQPVAEVTDAHRQLAQDMLEIMYEAPGIGLAANQVGRLEQLLVMDCERDPEAPRQPRILFNPQVIWASDETAAYEEGCLSIPEQYAEVVRPTRVTVAYLDAQGRPQQDSFTGLEATCVQHEIDHLNGILFWDHITLLKRNMLKRKLGKLKKERAHEAKLDAQA